MSRGGMYTVVCKFESIPPVSPALSTSETTADETKEFSPGRVHWESTGLLNPGGGGFDDGGHDVMFVSMNDIFTLIVSGGVWRRAVLLQRPLVMDTPCTETIGLILNQKPSHH